MKAALPLIITIALAITGCSDKYKHNASVKKAAAKLVNGCAEGDGVSCYKLAQAEKKEKLSAHIYKLQPDINFKDIYKTAIIYLKSECGASNKNSCRTAGNFYYKQNLRQAAVYYKKACNLNDPVGCRFLGRVLAKAPLENLKASRDAYEKAVDLNLKRCTDGVERYKSCDDAAYILVNYLKTPQSLKRGLELYHEGCEEGDFRNCIYAGRIYAQNKYGIKNISTAKQFYQKACNLNKKNCNLLKRFEN